MNYPSRREFLKSTFTTVCAAGFGGVPAESLAAAQSVSLPTADPAPLPAQLAIKKGLVYDMLPRALSHADRFKLARETGFDVVQAPTTPHHHIPPEIKKPAPPPNLHIA